MTEKCIGKAKFQQIRNDMFWSFLKFDNSMKGHFIDLEWSGYDDPPWWDKWSKKYDKKEQGGRKFRIDFKTCEVFEIIDECIETEKDIIKEETDS